jgi:hypothetical protein
MATVDNGTPLMPPQLRIMGFKICRSNPKVLENKEAVPGREVTTKTGDVVAVVDTVGITDTVDKVDVVDEVDAEEKEETREMAKAEDKANLVVRARARTAQTKDTESQATERGAPIPQI